MRPRLLILSVLLIIVQAASWSELKAQNSLDQGGSICTSATVIQSVPLTDNGNLLPGDRCGGPPFNDVFYPIVVPQTGVCAVAMCGSDGATQVRVWIEGQCCIGAFVARFGP